MTRRHFAVVALLSIVGVVGGVIVVAEYVSPVSHVEIEGTGWSKEERKYSFFVIRIDDSKQANEALAWRDARIQKDRDHRIRHIWRQITRTQVCENALRQYYERMTIVYENGRREEVYGAPDSLMLLLPRKPN